MSAIFDLETKQRKLIDDAYFLMDSEEFEDQQLLDFINNELESVKDNAENIIKWLIPIRLELQARATAQSEFARRQQVKAQQTENVDGKLKDKIMSIMQTFDIKKVESKWANVSRYQQEKLEWTGNVYDLPPELMRVKDPEPKLTDIKKAVKSGEIIKGASLVMGDVLRMS